MNPIQRWSLLGLLCIASAAQAGFARDRERLELVSAHAGEPVRSAHVTHVRSWESLGPEHMLLKTAHNRALLLHLDGFCSGLEASFQVVLVYQPPRLSAGFDKIRIRDRGPVAHRECRILEIRPVDTKALKAAEKAAREQAGPADGKGG